MKASVRNLYVQGNLRVVLKPLIDTLPLVGGVQVIWRYLGLGLISFSP